MSEEWFKENKYLNAAAEEFLEIYGNADRKKELLKIFGKTFLKYYEGSKKRNKLVEWESDFRRRIIEFFKWDALNSLNQLIRIRAGKIKSSDPIKDEVEVFSFILGSILGKIEYGICSPLFVQSIDKLKLGEVVGELMSAFDNLSIKLLEVYKPANFKYIGKRVEVIAGKHNTELTTLQRDLLKRIAYFFSR